VFDYCSKIKKNCAFAAKQGELTYCGLHTGTIAQNRVDYIPLCPKNKMKRR
jgi:hypothetical protein|tara:strand:- start:6 stop:158 length:153 start_codon:yes stop_codon:yes gene_type:complete